MATRRTLVIDEQAPPWAQRMAVDLNALWGRFEARVDAQGVTLDEQGAAIDVLEAVPPPTLVFTESFESAQQTITSAALLTLAHGLGVRPKLVFLETVCLTAQAGYAVGDTVMVSINNSDETTGRYNSVYYDTTNVYVRFSDAATVFRVANKTTGVHSTISPANWALVVRAWA